MEYELFSDGVIDQFYATIKNEITTMLKATKNTKSAIVGAFAINDVPLKKGGKTNVWIEYNANILPFGMVDVGVHECILFDEIPDIILDKYNTIKTMIFNESSTTKK